MKQHN